MKIAYDYQTFCLQRYGGISRYFTNLVSQLSALNQSPKVFAPLHNNYYLDELNSNLRYGYGVPKYPYKTRKLFRLASKLISTTAIRNWDPDVIHKTYYLDEGRKEDKPVVLTVYDMIHEKFPSYFPSNNRVSEQKRSAVNAADRIICISEATKNDLLEFFDVDESKLEVIHLASSVDASKSQEIRVSKPYFLYVGTRGGYKNFKSLLEAFARSKLLRGNFNIIAFGGGAFTGLELEEISRLGLIDNVEWTYGNDVLLNSYYMSASAYVCTSQYEGFGLPLVEAMNASCPILSNRGGSIEEVAGQAALYFDVSEIESITSALEKVVVNEDFKNDLIIQGQMRKKHFSWEKCAQNTLDVYRSLF